MFPVLVSTVSQVLAGMKRTEVNWREIGARTELNYYFQYTCSVVDLDKMFESCYRDSSGWFQWTLLLFLCFYFSVKCWCICLVTLSCLTYYMTASDKHRLIMWSTIPGYEYIFGIVRLPLYFKNALSNFYTSYMNLHVRYLSPPFGWMLPLDNHLLEVDGVTAGMGVTM
jgi:hypothetical protein